MNVLSWLAVVAAACIASPCAAAPLEAYGKLPTIEDVAISADGQKLAVLATNGEERRIAIRNLADGSTRLVGVGPIKVRGLYWAGSDHLLIEKSSTANILDLIGHDLLSGAASRRALLSACSDCAGCTHAVQANRAHWRA